MAFNRGRTGGFDSSGGQQFPPNYDASPGQFSGTQQEGGFIGTQESSSSPARPSPKRGGGYIQTLTPVTIRQLYNATQALSDDVFKVDGKELNQITLVGQVVRKTIQSTNVELEIDDSTGKIGVRMWLDLDDSGQEGDNSKTRTPWERGDYVRVIGNLRSFNNNRNVVAFRVQPVANFNEITYHLLDVIHVHLYNTKGPLETPQLQTQQAETETANRGGPGKSGAQPRPQGYGQSASRTRSQFTPLQKAIMDVISSSGKPKTGCSVGEICAALKNFGTENDVREAIEFLNAEGHLYSTIDEEHYRCADDSGN